MWTLMATAHTEGCSSDPVIGLAIRFELGRYHANPWGSHVNDAATEWPPSPWRLIRAMYSVARTNVNLADARPGIDAALQALLAGPPPVYELPRIAEGHTRHYMPERTYSALARGDTAKVIDGFVAIDPQAELRAWWNVTLDAGATDALALAARALGYLGRSEAVCTARLTSGAGPSEVSAAPADVAEAISETMELVDLLCPDSEGSLEAVATSVTELRKARRLVPPGTRHVTYAVARGEPVSSTRAPVRCTPTRPTLALLRLAGKERPAITDAVAVGQALRAALQSRHGKEDDGSASPTFSGRAGDERRKDQHRHAHYLALPDGHGRRVDRLIVWASEGFGPGEVAALAALDHLTMYGVLERMPLALGALGTTAELDLPGLLGPARAWHSLTPFGLVRHPKRRGGRLVDTPEDQVRRELSHRGLPDPDDVRLEAGSWHRFRSSRAGTSRLDRASVRGVRVRFPEPVEGPLALGAFSHYGLGLMIPGD
jgi:CRISPR-associated protein Csb2